jgi:hypothetical protein
VAGGEQSKKRRRGGTLFEDRRQKDLGQKDEKMELLASINSKKMYGKKMNSDQ